MGDCLFCAIASGDIGCSNVYEDEQVLAFLDIQPLQRGHTLVIPKRHATKLEDCSDADASALIVAAKALAPRICDAVGSNDSTIAINNGPEAGQEVGHVHMHIVPRREGDAAGPIHALFADRPTPDADELTQLADQIRNSETN